MLGEPTAQLLAILVVPVVAGMLCLLVASIWQVRMHPRERQQHRMVFSLADAFDPEHVAIWESQLPLLELLAAGVSEAKFCWYWERHCRRFPELYEGARPGDWLQLLCQHKLAEASGANICLTAPGRELMESLARRAGAHSGKVPGSRYERPKVDARSDVNRPWRS